MAQGEDGGGPDEPGWSARALRIIIAAFLIGIAFNSLFQRRAPEEVFTIRTRRSTVPLEPLSAC